MDRRPTWRFLETDDAAGLSRCLDAMRATSRQAEREPRGPQVTALERAAADLKAWLTGSRRPGDP